MVLKLISSLLSKTSGTWILNIFVGHGRIYVNKERSIVDTGTYTIFICSLLSGSDGTLSIFVL